MHGSCQTEMVGGNVKLLHWSIESSGPIVTTFWEFITPLTLRWYTPLTGALVVHRCLALFTEGPSESFTHGCQDQSASADSCHRCVWNCLKLPQVWGMWGHISGLRNPILYRATKERVKWKLEGGAAGSDLRPCSQEVAQGKGSSSQHCAAPHHST